MGARLACLSVFALCIPLQNGMFDMRLGLVGLMPDKKILRLIAGGLRGKLIREAYKRDSPDPCLVSDILQPERALKPRAQYSLQRCQNRPRVR